jgi:hypothetical protein
MSLEFEVTGGVAWEPGIYEGYLLKIEKRFKMFTNEDGSTEDRSFLLWTFALNEEGFEGATLTAVSSTSFGPKSKARGWASAILRRELEDGERIREDDLKGKPVMLSVGLEDKGSKGTFAKIEGLSAVRKKAKATG